MSLLEFLSAEEYLRRERLSDTKNEYVNGIVHAMAGGTMNHNRIARNCLVAIQGKLANRPCEVFSSDMKVRVDKANVFRYPDLSGLCGPAISHDEKRDAYCNPSLIVEVLSPSTESLDRGEKFNLYRLLESLVEYVLISQSEYRVERYRKSGGQWSAIIFNEPSDEVELRSVGVSLTLAVIYDRVEFQDADA